VGGGAIGVDRSARELSRAGQGRKGAVRIRLCGRVEREEAKRERTEDEAPRSTAATWRFSMYCVDIVSQVKATVLFFSTKKSLTWRKYGFLPLRFNVLSKRN